MNLPRLLGLGAMYGVAFAFIKSLFPQPFVLMLLQGNQGGSEGNLTVLALVYIGVGVLAGLISAPLFGGLLRLRRGYKEEQTPYVVRFALSLGLAALMGVISGLLTLGAYAVGILPSGGILDPLHLIESSNFPTGVPLLVAWSIARDLLPAGLTGLFLAPVGGGPLIRFYDARRSKPGGQRTWEAESEDSR